MQVKPKLAFLFLIIDSIPHEDIWEAFFKQAQYDQYSIIINSKSKDYKVSKFFSQYILQDSIILNWGDILSGFVHLFKHSIKNEHNTHFVFLSESCIPIKSFQYIYNTLYKHTKPWINTFFTDNNRSINWALFPRCDCMRDIVPIKYICKQQAWVLWDRKSVIRYLNDEEFIKKNIPHPFAPEEHVVLIYFKIKHIDINLVDNKHCLDCVTFAQWHNDGHKYQDLSKFGQSDLFTYNTISKAEFDYIHQNATSFFARKFTKDCKVIHVDKQKNIEVSLYDYLYELNVISPSPNYLYMKFVVEPKVLLRITINNSNNITLQVSIIPEYVHVQFR